MNVLVMRCVGESPDATSTEKSGATDVTTHPQVAPVLTTKTPRADLGPVLNGNGPNGANLRKTHPNLYLLVMTLATGCVLLGLNFLLLQPTFLIYHAPNELWGSIFLVLGMTKLLFLNFVRNLRAVRVVMAFAVTYILFIAAGATEPFIDGEGSLQLPLMYLVMAAIQIPLLLEPFINPWTAQRDE